MNLNEEIEIYKAKDMSSKKRKISDVKIEYTDMLRKYENRLRRSDRHIEEKRTALTYITKDANNIYAGMNYSKKRALIEKEIKELELSRRKVLDSIEKLRESENNMCLIVDKIYFDNIVMLNKIYYNIDLLDKTLS